MTQLNREVTMADIIRLEELAKAKCGLGHIAFCMNWPEAKVIKVAKDNGTHIYNIGEK